MYHQTTALSPQPNNNMLLTTSIEVRNLSSAQYAHNDFKKIETDVILATEDLADIVSQGIIDDAQVIYDKELAKETISDTEKELLQHVQLPIAIRAAYNYNRSNLVTHGDTGRKALLDKTNESMAWEWMIDRDDHAAIVKYQKTVDRLIRYLNKTDNQKWKASAQYKEALGLFIPNASVFSQYFSIDRSEMFFHIIAPLIREIQLQRIKPAIGEDYQTLITAMKGNTLDDDQKELLSYIQSAVPLLTIAKAVKRHSIQVMPEGVVQGYKSFTQGLNVSQAAPQASIEAFSNYLDKDAEQYFDQIKRYRQRHNPEALNYKLLPDNDPKKKYART